MAINTSEHPAFADPSQPLEIGPVRAAVGALAIAVALVLARDCPGEVLRGLVEPHAWMARVGADQAAATAAGAGLWVVAAWLAIGISIAVAGRLPGAVGTLARTVSRAVLPPAVWRLVAAAAGLSVLAAPVAAGATVAAHSRAGSAMVRAASTMPAHAVRSAVPDTARELVTPRWPTDDVLPAPRWPRSVPRAVPQPAPSTMPATGRTVVVRPGDSLWRLAARQLGARATPARIAADWPRWYATNHAEIGRDPDLIRPGERLRVPPPRTVR